MAKTRTILRRIRAIRNIRTVTKAMETVASARFRKVHNQSQAYRPFAVQVADMVGDLIARAEGGRLDHVLLVEPEGIRRDVLLVIGSDRGLCGSYNAGVVGVAIERMARLREAGYEVQLHVVGSRAVRYLRFRGFEIDRVYDDLGDAAEYRAAAALANSMMADFLARRIGGLEVAYMQFVSSGQQRPAIARLLPLLDLPGAKERAPLGEPAPYDFLPSAEQILDKLLPATVRLRLYECFLEAEVSEQLMRMSAMRAATDNADDMTHDLHVRYNRLRQMQITTELTEIIGGRGE